jgi:hypothetical protein
MPEIPLRISQLRQVARVATPAIRRSQDADVLEAEGIAEGAEAVASAGAGVFLRLAEARTGAAASHAMSQGTAVLNEAQAAANESTDFQGMAGAFQSSYEEALPGILEGVPDDGTRRDVNEKLNRAFLTRQADVRQRALSLERRDHQAKFQQYSVEVARMLEANPNSMTLTDGLDSWLGELANQVRIGSIRPDQAQAMRTEMFDLGEQINVREMAIEFGAFAAVESLKDPANHPHMTAETRLRLEDAYRIKDQADAEGQIDTLINQGIFAIPDDEGNLVPLETMADNFFLDRRITENQRATIIGRIARAKEKQAKANHLSVLGSQLGQGPGHVRYSPDDADHKKAANAEWHRSVDQWFNGPDPTNPIRDRTPMEVEQHAASFIERRGFVPTDLSLKFEGWMTSGTPEEQYAAAELYVLGTAGNPEKQDQFQWDSRIKQRAINIIRLGKATPEDRERPVNEALQIEAELATETGQERAARLEVMMSNPELMDELMLDGLDDLTFNSPGLGQQEFGNTLAGGMQFDIGDTSSSLPAARIPPEMRSLFEFHVRAEYLKTGNPHTATKEAQRRMAAEFTPTAQGGRPRYTKFAVEKHLPAINGSHEWFDNQVKRKFALFTGIVNPRGLENTNIGKVRAAARGFEGLFNKWVQFASLGKPEAPPDPPLKMLSSFMDTLYGPGPGPKLWIEPTPNAGRDPIPEYHAFYISEDGERTIVMDPMTSEPWVIAPDHTTTPEWAQHLRRQEEEKKADFATVELENRNLAFERKHGMTAMAAMGIERGVNIGNTANDAKAALAAMTGEDRKEMRALVEASTGELIATAESVVTGTVSGLGDKITRVGKGAARGLLRAGTDVSVGMWSILLDTLSNDGFSEFFPGPPGQDLGFFGMDPDWNEYADRLDELDFEGEELEPVERELEPKGGGLFGN